MDQIKILFREYNIIKHEEDQIFDPRDARQPRCSHGPPESLARILGGVGGAAGDERKRVSCGASL